jgi:hypothetical protein
MNIFKKYLKTVHENSILNTTRKKVFIYSIVMYFPAVTLLFGSPYPDMLKQFQNPFHIFNLDEVTVQLIETLSTALSIIGTLTIGIFWIHRTSNNRHNETNETIIDLKKEFKEELDARFKSLEKKIDDKDKHQTNIFDQKILGNAIEIGHLKESDQEMKQDIRNIERNLYNLKGQGGQQD